MKNIFVWLMLCMSTSLLFSQEKIELYNTSIDGIKQINDALVKAKSEKKHVLLQVGGNWCPWCIRFNKFCTETPKVDSLLKAGYVVIHLNYSRENKNYPSLQRLEYPERFGFPVLVVLNSKGDRIHTQDSGFLEKDKGYDTTKVVTFLKNWTPEALNPENYKPVDENKEKKK